MASSTFKVGDVVRGIGRTMAHYDCVGTVVLGRHFPFQPDAVWVRWADGDETWSPPHNLRLEKRSDGLLDV